MISLLVVWPAFGTSARFGVKAQAPAWMGAVDGFVIAKARFLREGLGLGSWNHYWFLGMPGQHIGSPIVPFVLSLISADNPASLFRVWRGMVAVGVVGTVVGTYFFVKEISKGKREFPAIFVSLFILLIPSVVVIFPQIWLVASQYGWPSWTVFSAFYLGEGQNVIGFVLVLVALKVAWELLGKWEIGRARILALWSRRSFWLIL